MYVKYLKLFLIKTLFIGFSGGTGYVKVALLELLQISAFPNIDMGLRLFYEWSTETLLKQFFVLLILY